MQRELTDVLEELESPNQSVREEALSQIALVLERSTFRKVRNAADDEAAFYASQLAPALMAVELTREEQREIVRRISVVAQRYPSDVTALWALSKARPDVALGEVLRVAADTSEHHDADWLFQLLVALRNCLLMDESGRLPLETLSLLEKHDTASTLRRMTASSDARVSELASQLLARVPT